MNLHPIATLHMANGSKIVVELLPEAAPNTVNSFVYAASRGFMDHHAIQRIVPGNWVDVTYQAFGHKECQYLIPNEFELHPEIEPLDSHQAVSAWADTAKTDWPVANSFSRCVTARIIRESIRFLAKSSKAWMKSGVLKK